MNVESKTPIVVAILAAIALFVYYYFNKAKKFLGYLTYSLSAFKVHSVSLSNILCKASIAINNPTDTAMSIQDYKVEIYYSNPSDKSRSLLASSPVNQLAIPAKQSITITTDVNISTASAAKLLSNIVAQIIAGNDIASIFNNQLKNNAVVVLKATVAGQYLEKEFTIK